MTPTILRLPEVTARTGLPRSTIHLRMSEGTFPASIPLGVRSVGWVASEIDVWISQRIAQSRQSHRTRRESASSAQNTMTTPTAHRH